VNRPNVAELRLTSRVLLWLHSELRSDDPVRDEISHVRWALHVAENPGIRLAESGPRGRPPKAAS
jgi:hypothetical protein